MDRQTGSVAGSEERLREALRQASDPAADPGNALELDQQVARTLAALRSDSALLCAVPVELLQELMLRVTARLLADPNRPRELREVGWSVLDGIRHPAVLRRIEPGSRENWAGAVLGLLEASDYTVGLMWRRRVEHYGTKTLFEWRDAGRPRSMKWRRAATLVDRYARTLLAIGADRGPIAILSENRIEMALLDLACLGNGMLNVLVPANASDSDVGFILDHSGARTVIVSGDIQLRKVLKNRGSLPRLERILSLERVRDESAVATLDSLAAEADGISSDQLLQRAEACRIGDRATLMYTSGTTGTPKAIPFSQRNVMFKRFARGLALPELSDRDVFLCFLPLFHTFGRFLEMIGCIYWGARYCFLESTSLEGLLRGMRRHRPTVFISVPKKWIQLHGEITRDADPMTCSDEELRAVTRRVTGGRLRWGLSAAGHLDSDIFRLFQQQGTELMSGFGMTEATGGITMTPPGEYRDGSLGVGLPGIELKLADDGELLIRGPYVTEGYVDPDAAEAGFDADGWLHTGDLMSQDEAGHFQLIDRKKEIYKNVKGETIAPQRIENMFREFESVGRAFLIGDHREYNTLLIYPDPQYRMRELEQLDSGEIRNHFRSLVVSVNQFLAPYERIVDFALIDRDLEAERGELTEKGTPRRKTVERSFADTVRELYRATAVRVGEVDLILPNWLFQVLGLTSQDIHVDKNELVLSAGKARLHVRRVDDELAEIGSCSYRHEPGTINLGRLLTTPRLWLGNEQLHDMVPLDAATRQRSSRGNATLHWGGRTAPYRPRPSDRERVCDAIPAEPDLLDLHPAAGMLFSEEPDDALQAVNFLQQVLTRKEDSLNEPARRLLCRVAGTAPLAVTRAAFLALAPVELESRFYATLRRFFGSAPDLLDEATRATLVQQHLSEAKMESIVRYAQHCCARQPAGPHKRHRIQSLLSFLSEFGSAHPPRYRRLRAVLVRLSRFAVDADLRKRATEAAETLERGFREWLGRTAEIAVDPETGQEYRWDEVVVFEEDIPVDDQQRLLQAIRKTAFIKEGVFLFSRGASIRLSDIPPGGVWIRLLGTRHGKSVYRITVQTRWQGSYDIAANLNHDLSAEQVREEIDWLILSGDPSNRASLVEDFGGYWPEQDLWSEEFIAGETLDHAMRRLSRRKEGTDRLVDLWPFMAWGTLSAYADFWQRSGQRLEIADPGMTNVIVPTEDYQSGVRLVSLSRRRPHDGLLAMMFAFRDNFVIPAGEQYPCLKDSIPWSLIFSAVLEVVGPNEGVKLFGDALAGGRQPDDTVFREELTEFLDQVERRGFLPMRAYFAARRYRTWAALNAEPTAQARALTLQELFETYGLQTLTERYPELRIRVFLETVFEDCDPALAEGLSEMIRGVRDGRIHADEMIDAVDELRAKLPLGDDEQYFMARLSYPYLRPEDAADFVRTDMGGKRQSEIVVTLEDHDGAAFRVRHALNPKEIERLYRLFLATKLDVRFGMEHRHLVALNDRGQIIAGIYYEMDDENRSAHLEKIVVAERYRRKGVADGLMNEFLNRLRAAGMKTVTTGFFRPEYFYGYGFRIEKRYAGLVKTLSEPAAAG